MFCSFVNFNSDLDISVICLFAIFILVIQFQTCFVSLERSSVHRWGKELSERCSWIFHSLLTMIRYVLQRSEFSFLICETLDRVYLNLFKGFFALHDLTSRTGVLENKTSKCSRCLGNGL